MSDFISGNHESRFWCAWSEDGLAGAIILVTWGHENPTFAEAAGWVRPDHRRKGIGRSLVERAIDEAVTLGRHEIALFAREKTPGSALLESVGFTAAQRNIRSILYLEETDRSQINRWADGEASRIDGYDLVRWAGHCPDEYLEPYARALDGMHDAPIGDLGWNPVTHDAERIRRGEDATRRSGVTPYVLCVRELATGVLAGVTAVSIHPGSPRAYQGDTTVLAPYRGRGFGLWLKAEMIRWLIQAEPEVTQYVTWNAADNTHMRAVNTRLGYRPADTWIAWNRKIGPRTNEPPAVESEQNQRQ